MFSYSLNQYIFILKSILSSRWEASRVSATAAAVLGGHWVPLVFKDAHFLRKWPYQVVQKRPSVVTLSPWSALEKFNPCYQLIAPIKHFSNSPYVVIAEWVPVRVSQRRAQCRSALCPFFCLLSTLNQLHSPQPAQRFVQSGLITRNIKSTALFLQIAFSFISAKQGSPFSVLKKSYGSGALYMFFG